MGSQFPRLFEPSQIKGVTIRNRLVFSPMYTGYAARDGTVTERLIRYHEERSKGGVGMIIVEYTHIDDKASKAAHNMLAIYDDGFGWGLARLAEGIKRYGARACLQLVHCGRQKFLGTPPVLSASPVPWEALLKRKGPMSMPREMTIDEINGVVEAFGEAARRVEKAGFDMVELHGAHGYLITCFLSRHTNRRTDCYGGDLKGRMRFVLEVVRSIRSKVSPGFPIGIRLSGSEYMDDGVSVEETVQVSKELEKAGVDYIHISGGNHHTTEYQIAPMYLPLALHVQATEAVKKAVRIPVMASGSITSPELGEEILASGKADFISMGRPFLADQHFANKAREGRPEDIRRCIRCNEGCNQRASRINRDLGCSVNVATGREELYAEITPAPKAKRVMVIGGGPGGMEAARVAALRGHRVVLYEMTDKLGGHLIVGSVPGFKQDIRYLTNYLTVQLEKLNVQVVKGTEVTPEIVKEVAPDAVIVATGSAEMLLQVPGMDKPLIARAISVLNGAPVGESVVVVGGGRIGCETALYLAEQGKMVRLTTRQDEAGADMHEAFRNVLHSRFQKYGVEVHLRVSLERITDQGVVVTNRTGDRYEIQADTVIPVAGMEPRRELVARLLGEGVEVHQVGDCVKPRDIHDAIHEGFLAAWSL